MSKQLTTPALYRLTLTDEAFDAVGANKPFKFKAAFQRPDGKWNVAIAMSTLDQLQTAALPKENLSDTVLRLYPSPNNS